MNDKLQHLTDKLYEEGLSAGRAEGERLVNEAKEQAAKIVAEATNRAAKIVAEAENKAAEQSKNAMTELTIAARGVVATLKSTIADLVVSQAITEPLDKAITPSFMADFLVALAENWSGKPTLEAMMPESRKAELEKAFEASAAKILKAGIEVGYSKSVKSGFRVAEQGGKYYIGFSDEDFEALLSEFLKPKAMQLLFE